MLQDDFYGGKYGSNNLTELDKKLFDTGSDAANIGIGFMAILIITAAVIMLLIGGADVNVLVDNLLKHT